MELLKEAAILFENKAGNTFQTFQSMLELRDQARGEEAALIERLVELFTEQASPETLKQVLGHILEFN